MKANAITKEQINTSTTVHEIEHTDTELYKVSMYTTAGIATAVGIWGLVCLSSAIFENGGPVEMAKSLIQTITGA